MWATHEVSGTKSFDVVGMWGRLGSGVLRIDCVCYPFFVTIHQDPRPPDPLPPATQPRACVRARACVFSPLHAQATADGPGVKRVRVQVTIERLVTAGLLSEGQALHCRGIQAVINGSHMLEWVINGQMMACPCPYQSGSK